MELKNRIENAEIFRKALEEYTSLCRMAPYIRLKNGELREITPDDYRIGLPYKEADMQSFVLYVEMRSRAFRLLIDRYERTEMESDVSLHVRFNHDDIIELDGYPNGIFVKYIVLRKDNL